MKQLNKMQREKAAVLTAKFYEDHPFVDVPREFVVYKMTTPLQMASGHF